MSEGSSQGPTRIPGKNSASHSDDLSTAVISFVSVVQPRSYLEREHSVAGATLLCQRDPLPQAIPSRGVESSRVRCDVACNPICEEREHKSTSCREALSDVRHDYSIAGARLAFLGTVAVSRALMTQGMRLHPFSSAPINYPSAPRHLAL